MEVGQSFDTYQDFEIALTNYCNKNYVQYTVTDSKKISYSNKVLQNEYLTKFKFRFINYQCKHGPKNKKSTKGLGIRPNQSTFNIGCQAHLSASIDRSTSTFVIRAHSTIHNHERSKEIFEHYPEQRRRSKCGITSRQTKMMTQMGEEFKLLNDYLRDQQNDVITLKDLHNIQQDTNDENGEENILLEEFESIMINDPDASIGIITEEKGTFHALILVTGHMKTIFRKFPEVVLIDSTFSENKHNIPLFTFVVEDENGEPQPVAYCFMANTEDSKMQSLIIELKKFLDFDLVRVLVIDKDLKEVPEIQFLMPCVQIQIRKFFVLQDVQQELNRSRVRESERKQINSLVEQLVYAETTEAYEETLESIQHIGNAKFNNFMETKWLPLSDYWATNHKSNLSNTEDCRRELYNQKIEALLASTLSLKDIIKSVASDMDDFDQEITDTGELSSNSVLKQKYYTLTSQASNSNVGKGNVHVKVEESHLSLGNEENVNVETGNVHVKVEESNLSLGNEENVNQQQLSKREIINLKRSGSTRKTQTQKKKLKLEKFNNAMSQFEIIANFLTQFGAQEFSQKLSKMTEVYNWWLEGENVAVVPVNSST